MKIVGISVCVAVAVGLVGCGNATQPTNPGAATKPAITRPATHPAVKADTAGKEVRPVAATPRGVSTVKNGVTVHPVAPGTASSRLPGLTGKAAAPAAPAAPKGAAGKSLVGARTPKQASAKGRLAAGYPTQLAQVSGSQVQVSSVAATGNKVQVGLQASSGRSSAEVLANYRSTLLSMGFTEITAAGVAGASAARFTRGAEVVTVSAKTTAKRTNYSIFAVLRTSG